jgi:hypothetical protein
MIVNLPTLTKEKRELPMKSTCIAAGTNSARLAARMKVFGLTNHQLASVVLLCCFVCLCTQLLQASPQSFTFLQPGFTQQIFGVSNTFMAGVAFASNGDPWVVGGTVGNCLPGTTLLRFGSPTFVQNGTTLHTESTVTNSNVYCGLTNHPNGRLYANIDDGVNGVAELDGSTGAAIRAFGAPGNGLGITVDPITNRVVYVAKDCRSTSTCTIKSIDTSPTPTSIDFAVLTPSQATFVDGIAFDPTGNFLFLATRSPSPFKLTILDRTGAIVRQVTMASEPDGIAFHGTAPHFVVTNNNDGTMTRFDFASDDYTQIPTITTFASGGFRGDLAQVGPDHCLYVTQDGTRYDDGTVTTEDSLVRICGNFAGTRTTVDLTFPAGTNTRVADFNADDPVNHHSWKATVNATQPFTISVSAYETECGGGCPSGVDNDPSDFQCRFHEYFSDLDTFLPKPVPYSHGKCVFYRVENPPPDTYIASDILFTVGYNEPFGTPYCDSLGGVTRFFRDPSQPPPPDAVSNHSFAFDFTTFFNVDGKPGDPTVGGDVTKSMNDYVVACRFAPPTGTATFLKPKAGATYNRGSAIPFSLQVKDSTTGAFIMDAATFPNAIPLTIFMINGGVQTEIPTFGNPGGSPGYWTYSTLTNSYTANSKTPKGILAGSYRACVNSMRNLDGSTTSTPPPYFAQTCINFTIK